MDSASFECTICYESFNVNDRFPRILPLCGHTLCEKCIKSLLRAPPILCPLDQTKYPRTDLAYYPKNFALAEGLDKKQDSEVCKQHGEKITFFCVNDKKRLCSSCAFTDHRDPRSHLVLPLKDVEADYKKKKAELKSAIETMTKWGPEMMKVFKSQCLTAEKQVDLDFDELLNILHKKRKIAKEKLNQFFQEEERRLARVIETWDAKRNLALSIIAVADTQGLYQIEDTGLGDIFDGSLFKARKEEESNYSKSVSEILKKFKSILAAQKSFSEDLTFPNDIFLQTRNQNFRNYCKEEKQESQLERKQEGNAINRRKNSADPSRFLIKSELEDGSGFKIIGCSHIFKYDQYKGWYDEYGNHYDSNGCPQKNL